MRLWNGLNPHSIVIYKEKMYKIKKLYEKDGIKVADLINGENAELTGIDIMQLEKADD